MSWRRWATRGAHAASGGVVVSTRHNDRTRHLFIPIQYTCCPSCKALAAACRSSDVFPAPDGPYTSVTFPRAYPPTTWWPGRLEGARSVSSRVRPVGTVRAPCAWRRWSVCEAETVGSLSTLESVAAIRCEEACTHAKTAAVGRFCLPLLCQPLGAAG